jgi:hypothetical protein
MDRHTDREADREDRHVEAKYSFFAILRRRLTKNAQYTLLQSKDKVGCKTKFL